MFVGGQAKANWPCDRPEWEQCGDVDKAFSVRLLRPYLSVICTSKLLAGTVPVFRLSIAISMSSFRNLSKPASPVCRVSPSTRNRPLGYESAGNVLLNIPTAYLGLLPLTRLPSTMLPRREKYSLEEVGLSSVEPGMVEILKKFPGSLVCANLD